MQLEISALGEQLLRRDMLRFADNLDVPDQALHAVANTLRQVALAQFDTQGGHASGGWARLAASTLQQKVRKGLDPRILRATERLMRSLTEKDGPDHIEEVLSGQSLRFGTAVPYATFHQTGTSRMPQRRPLALTETDKRTIVKQIQAELVKGLRATR